MNKLLVGIGVWIISDAIYSWSLYKGDKNYKGNPQDFCNDHWVRLLRGILGVALVVIGGKK